MTAVAGTFHVPRARPAAAYDIECDPQPYARLAGAIYLAVILLGGFAEGFVTNVLVVPGDDAATIAAILQRPELWQSGVLANLFVPLIAVPQLWLEYRLLRPAGRELALLFVLLNIAALSVEAVSKVFQLMVLPLASEAPSLAPLALLGHDVAFYVTLIFFGSACLVIGALIWRSGYLPRVIGVLMGLAGVCYLIACFAELFAPSLGRLINPGILLPVLVGEASFCLWLLIKGVDVARWAARHAPAT